MKFEQPIGSVVCDCGATLFIYPDMIPGLEEVNLITRLPIKDSCSCNTCDCSKKATKKNKK